MKKLVSLFLVLALVIAMASPAMALSSTMTYKSTSGTVSGITYGTTTGASTSKVTAKLTTSKSTTLYAEIQAETFDSALNTFVGIKEASDAIADVAVSVSVTPGSGKYFSKAYVYYIFGTTTLPTVTMS